MEPSAVIYGRPPSYSDADPGEPRAITPAQFLRGGPSTEPLAAHVALDSLDPNGAVQRIPAEADRRRKN